MHAVTCGTLVISVDLERGDESAGRPESAIADRQKGTSVWGPIRLPSGMSGFVENYGDLSLSRRRFRLVFEQRGKDHAYGMTARVTPGITKSADLFEFNAVDPGLFKQLARGRRFKRLLVIDEPAGKGPAPFERLALAPDEQDPRAALQAME